MIENSRQDSRRVHRRVLRRRLAYLKNNARDGCGKP